MRYAIISDLHSNLDALERVIEDIRKQKVDRHLCLGDIIGYGAQPNECIRLVREELKCLTIAGNHDWAALGKTNIDYFNAYAKEATLWTREQLSEDEVKYIDSLPLIEHLPEDFTLVHGTLYNPELFDYIQTSYDAYLSLQALDGRVCFLGHSHVPITFFQGEMISYTLSQEISLEIGVKALVNVGSVGQPRDDNPKASYAIYDTDKRKVWIRRIEYDIESAGQKIRDAGLPEVLAERLKYGR
ncbi:MAG: metallophosphoesterase family protein [Planctomycetota bacterium]|nr:metallophosphoesterase family protein [Planctomycetota bacterium]